LAVSASILHDDLELDPERIVAIFERLLAENQPDLDTGYRASEEDAAAYALELATAEAFAEIDAVRAVDEDLQASPFQQSEDVPF
jgi:hypothetical protein